MGSRRNAGRAVALGGMLAALAVVIMCLGTVIPVATYVCPIACMVLLLLVNKSCGVRIAWAWYGAVAILSLLLAPDKEAAAVFLFLGYYPILKPWLDHRRGSILWKFAFFNTAVILLYTVLMKVIGMEQVLQDFEGFGLWMTGALLALGNITFYLLDRLLGRNFRRKGRG